MLNLILCLLSGLLAQAATVDIHKLDFLHGEWEGDSSYGHLQANFGDSRGSVMLGTNKMTNDKDEVIFTEHVQIRQVSDVLMLYPIPFGNPMVSYTCDDTTGPVITFKNPKQLYPRMISYQEVSATEMKFILQGMQGDVDTSHEFMLKRTKAEQDPSIKVYRYGRL